MMTRSAPKAYMKYTPMMCGWAMSTSVIIVDGTRS
jgi:hypothetical protein